MNEIEQLKRDSEVLYRDNVYLSEVCDSLRASNARLRDALENLCDTIEPVVGLLVTVEARAALEGKR